MTFDAKVTVLSVDEIAALQETEKYDPDSHQAHLLLSPLTAVKTMQAVLMFPPLPTGGDEAQVGGMVRQAWRTTPIYVATEFTFLDVEQVQPDLTPGKEGITVRVRIFPPWVYATEATHQRIGAMLKDAYDKRGCLLRSEASDLSTQFPYYVAGLGVVALSRGWRVYNSDQEPITYHNSGLVAQALVRAVGYDEASRKVTQVPVETVLWL